MIIQAELKCKQTECEADPCAVDKVIELPSPRFKQFSRALLADYDFIAEIQLRPVQCLCSQRPQLADTGYGDRPQLSFAGRALAG